MRVNQLFDFTLLGGTLSHYRNFKSKLFRSTFFLFLFVATYSHSESASQQNPPPLSRFEDKLDSDSIRNIIDGTAISDVLFDVVNEFMDVDFNGDGFKVGLKITRTVYDNFGLNNSWTVVDQLKGRIAVPLRVSGGSGYGFSIGFNNATEYLSIRSTSPDGYSYLEPIFDRISEREIFPNALPKLRGNQLWVLDQTKNSKQITLRHLRECHFSLYYDNEWS